MADGEGNAGTGDTPTLTAPEIIGDDNGTFVKDRQGVLPEELRDDPSLKTIGSLHDLAKGLVHAKAQVGKDKVILPGENATDEEWAEFYNLTGKPKTSDEYRLDVSEELKDHFEPETLLALRAVCHQAGLSQRNVDPLWGFLQKLAVDRRAEQDATADSNRKAAEKTLRDRWGIAYDERLHIVNRMIAENTASPEEQEQVLHQ